MSEAIVTPKLISWALERAHVSIDSIAKRINVTTEKILSWENGEKLPTFKQAQKLAHILSVPFGYLFLSTPPKEEIPLPDLRTVRDEEFATLSPNFHDLLNDVLRKQQWYQEYLKENEEKPISYVGSFKLTDNVTQVAENMRNFLGINEDFCKEAISWEDFLKKTINNAEDQGILILRSGIVGSNTHRKLSVNEFRGFSICDDYAPVIFINSRDAKAAQIFTLAHELAHLWVGESGISNLNLRTLPSQQNGRIEIFCDKVAAEFLVPITVFKRKWNTSISINNNLYSLVRVFRVSSIVILRRAYEVGLITKAEYFEHYNQELDKHTHTNRKSKGGDFYNSFLARNNNRITEAIISNTVEGKTLYRDAAKLLNVKVGTVNRIAVELGLR